MPINTQNTFETPFYEVIFEIIGIWGLANLGYYTVLPIFGVSISYNSSPVTIALYFLFWVIVTIIYFWKAFKAWFIIDSWIWVYTALSLLFSVVVGGLIYIFSQLPSFSGPEVTLYTDILFAQSWYFLPKAIEILIQQLLITVLVLELFFRFHTLKNVVIGYALCFGGAHIILFALNGSSVTYSLLMTCAASLTSLIFPYLMLRVRGGFVYAYMIHILYYIALATVLHVWPFIGYVS